MIDSGFVFSSGFKTFKANCFIPWSSIFLFSNALLIGEYVILVCSIVLLWSEGNVYSPVRYSCLSILPDNNDDIFAVSMLTLL